MRALMAWVCRLVNVESACGITHIFLRALRPRRWMQAVRTSRMCVSDPAAAGGDIIPSGTPLSLPLAVMSPNRAFAIVGMLEDARRISAESELDSARDKKSDPEAELSRIEEELEAVQGEHRCAPLLHHGPAACVLLWRVWLPQEFGYLTCRSTLTCQKNRRPTGNWRRKKTRQRNNLRSSWCGMPRAQIPLRACSARPAALPYADLASPGTLQAAEGAASLAPPQAYAVFPVPGNHGLSYANRGG